jgi:glycosyltransferase involved in cell wall biosynthesis
MPIPPQEAIEDFRGILYCNGDDWEHNVRGTMRIAIITDAWYPQINGVVTTLASTRQELERLGHRVLIVTPGGFKTFPCPTYPEIRLALWPRKTLHVLLGAFKPDAIHIATEGTLGLAARGYCVERHLPFTTSFHTRFPEYIQLRFYVPPAMTYALLRWFHGRAKHTLVSTPSLREDLSRRGFRNLVLWSRGVNTELFRPRPKDFLSDERPIFTYLGRVAVEKNVEAFLRLDLPGTKYVIGDGPQLADLQQKYPGVRFIGAKTGEVLVQYLAAADVFVFPSRTDTFGLVMLEAMACGVPVAAFPVQGPLDVVRQGETGILDDDLGRAARQALALDGRRCREFAVRLSWQETTKQFLGHLYPITDSAAPVARAEELTE